MEDGKRGVEFILIEVVLNAIERSKSDVEKQEKRQNLDRFHRFFILLFSVLLSHTPYLPVEVKTHHRHYPKDRVLKSYENQRNIGGL